MTFDIYTNRVPFGLLTEDEQRQLREHKGKFEVCSIGDFFWQVRPLWCPASVYRAVRPALTKPSINWDHVADEFIALATDADNSPWLYSKVPNDSRHFWVGGGRGTLANGFSSFVPGTCDWRDSLVIRPGYEGGDA